MKCAYLLVVLFTLSSCAPVVSEESSTDSDVNNEITTSTEQNVLQDPPQYVAKNEIEK